MTEPDQPSARPAPPDAAPVPRRRAEDLPSDKFELVVAKSLRALWTFGAVVTLALMATIALAIFGFTASNTAAGRAAAIARTQAALGKREAALAQSAAVVASSQAEAAISRLQAEASGECYRVNDLRWAVDKKAYQAWLRDREVAQILAHIDSGAIRRAGRAFAAVAHATTFLPLTNCTEATADPTSYMPPLPVSFARESRSYLRALLAHPPLPPAPGGSS